MEPVEFSIDEMESLGIETNKDGTFQVWQITYRIVGNLILYTTIEVHSSVGDTDGIEAKKKAYILLRDFLSAAAAKARSTSPWEL